jgi:acetyltransferase-like isoleucine patch superfamily enzyme
MSAFLESLSRSAFHLPSQLLGGLDGVPWPIGRVVDMVRARVVLRDCRLGSRVAATGRVSVRNRGTITIGNRVLFSGGMVPSALSCDPGATLRIWDDSYLNYGVSIQARHSVDIGKRCLIASFTRLSDEQAGKRRGLLIGDDVWIAYGVTIGPGVTTIGNGSILAAGSTIVHDVPDGCVATGSPARYKPLELAT